MAQIRQHETVISLPASPEEVWSALIEVGAVQTWYAPEARIEPREGGEYFVSWGPGLDGPGVIEVFEPHRHLRVVCLRNQTTACEDPAGMAAVEPVRVAMDFHLESEHGSTTLRLIHSGFLASAEWDREFEGTKQGWPVMLRIMRYSLVNHPHKPGRQRWLYVQAPVPQAEAWARFAALFDGQTPEYSNAPSSLCVPWTEMGDGLVHAAFGSRHNVTGISLHVVLYGDAASRIEEAAGYWNSKLAGIYEASALAV